MEPRTEGQAVQWGYRAALTLLVRLVNHPQSSKALFRDAVRARPVGVCESEGALVLIKGHHHKDPSLGYPPVRGARRQLGTPCPPGGSRGSGRGSRRPHRQCRPSRHPCPLSLCPPLPCAPLWPLGRAKEDPPRPPDGLTGLSPVESSGWMGCCGRISGGGQTGNARDIGEAPTDRRGSGPQRGAGVQASRRRTRGEWVCGRAADAPTGLMERGHDLRALEVGEGRRSGRYHQCGEVAIGRGDRANIFVTVFRPSSACRPPGMPCRPQRVTAWSLCRA
jgi:hypothetical protein